MYRHYRLKFCEQHPAHAPGGADRHASSLAHGGLLLPAYGSAIQRETVIYDGFELYAWAGHSANLAITASAAFSPSIAAEVIPPAYPAPSPQG